MADNIYNTIKKVENMLNKYDGYKLTIYDKNKTYGSNKDKEEEIQSSTYAVGFQIPPVNDEYEEYYNKGFRASKTTKIGFGL